MHNATDEARNANAMGCVDNVNFLTLELQSKRRGKWQNMESSHKECGRQAMGHSGAITPGKHEAINLAKSPKETST